MQSEAPREGRFSFGGLLRLVGLACLGISWLLPNHYLPWYAFYSDAMAFMAVFAWALSVATEGAKSVSIPRIALIAAAVMVLPWLQFAGGLVGFSGEAWLSTLYLGGFAGSIFIGFEWARRLDGDDLLLQTVVAATLAAGILSTGLCLFQWLRLEDWLGIFIANVGSTARPFANLAQPNLLATLLVMSVVCLVWTYERRRIDTWGLACGAAFLAVGLSFTQSRAGYVSAAAVCLWWSIKYTVLERPRLERRWAAAWLVLLATLSAILPRLSTAFDLAGDRPVTLFDNNGRWLMWKQIGSGILASPWIGYGWDHTPAAQMSGALNYPGILATGYAHNIGLDAMAWLGIPLGAAACAAGAFWLTSRALSARGQLPVFAFAVALPVVVHSGFEFSFAYAMFLFPVGIMFGAVEAFHPRAAVVTSSSSWILALSLALGILGFQIAREYVLAEDDFRFLRFEALRMGKTPETHSRPHFLVLTQMDALLEVGRVKPMPGMTREQIERIRLVTLKYSWAPPAFLYAAALGVNGFPEQQARQMRVIHGMYGDAYYSGAVSEMEELRERWPQGASGTRP